MLGPQLKEIDFLLARRAEEKVVFSTTLTKRNAFAFCSTIQAVNYTYIGNSNIFYGIKASRKNSPSGRAPLWDRRVI